MRVNFTRSLPDPYHKAVFLCMNQHIGDIAYNGWGGGYVGNVVTNTNGLRFGKIAAGIGGTNNISYIYFNNNSYFDPLAYGNDYTIELWANGGPQTHYSTTGSGTKDTGNGWDLTDHYCAILLTTSDGKRGAEITNALDMAIAYTSRYQGYWNPTYIYSDADGYYRTSSSTPITRSIANRAATNSNPAASTNENNLPQIYGGSSSSGIHFCQVRKDDQIYFFINGNLWSQQTSNADFINTNSGKRLFIGNSPNKNSLTGDTLYQFQGTVQCIKFSTIARYTENFAPNKPW